MMIDIQDRKCENQNCRKKGAMYERNGKLLCRSCALKYDGKPDVPRDENPEDIE